MQHILENEALKVIVDDHGAQLLSILDKATETEYLWQGDERYWKDHAIMLFPVCGRLIEGRYTYRGESYNMSIHGFIRNVDLAVEAESATALTLSYRDNDMTREQYPFAFLYTVTFTLVGNEIRHAFTVKNTGEEILPFGIGGHPGFNVPLEKGTDFADYYVEFSQAVPVRKLILSDTCFMTDASELFPLEGGRIYRLHHDMFDNDAIFLTDLPDAVTLKSDKTTKSVTVSWHNMPYLGFWHCPRTEAPYLCIEPWNGMPADDGIVDDMATKKYMNRLEPGKSENFGFTIAIHH